MSCTLMGAKRAPAQADTSPLTLEQLATSLVQQHADITSAAAELEKSKINRTTVWRVNDPTISTLAKYGATELKDTTVPSEFDIDYQQVDFGMEGRYVPWGLGYSLTQTYLRQKQSTNPLTPGIEHDGTVTSLKLELDLLDGAGFLVGKLPQKKADASLRQNQARLDQVSQATLKELVQKYLEALLTQQQIEYTIELRDQAAKLDENYKRLFKEGTISKIELLSSDLQVRNHDASLLRLNSLKRTQLRDLLAFAGMDLRAFADRPLKPLEKRILDPARLERIKSGKASGDNPELRVIEQQRKLNAQELSELANDRSATLQLVGEQSWAKNPSATTLTDGDGYANGWYVGVKLEFPWDNTEARAAYDAKVAERGSIDAQSTYLRRSTSTLLTGYLAEMSDLQDQLRLVQEIETLAAERFRANLPLLESSTRSRIEIFDFQNQIREQQFRKAELNILLLRIEAEIAYLSGTPLIMGH
jgi:outer membrane protein TolC